MAEAELLRHMIRADAQRVSHAVAQMLGHARAGVRVRARKVMKDLGHNEDAIETIVGQSYSSWVDRETAALSARVAELSEEAAQLPAVPLNMREAIVGLAGAVRGGAHRRDESPAKG